MTVAGDPYELRNAVETALAKALVLAAEANRWDVVSTIADELQRRGTANVAHRALSGRPRQSSDAESVGEQGIHPIVVDIVGEPARFDSLLHRLLQSVGRGKKLVKGERSVANCRQLLSISAESGHDLGHEEPRVIAE